MAARRPRHPDAVTGLPDFSGLVAENGAAVVNISVTEKAQKGIVPGAPGDGDDPLSQFFHRFKFRVPNARRRARESDRVSSSVSDGYVLTNAHVVADASEVTVKLTDRREFAAKVIGVDKRSDVALIKIPATNLPSVHFGDSARLRPGQWAIAIGSPFGFENSVTAGVISATGRPLPDDNGQPYVPYIQTDAAVNPGQFRRTAVQYRRSGDGHQCADLQPHRRLHGHVIRRAINLALNVKDQLLKNGKVARSRIGVSVQDINQQLALNPSVCRSPTARWSARSSRRAPATRRA